MFIIHPQVGNQKPIIDAEYFASLMGVVNDHKVALADRQYTWIRDDDYGILSPNYITRLVSCCNQEAVVHLRSDPGE